MERSVERVPAPQLADWALARGIRSMTTEEIAAHLAVSPDHVRVRLSAPRARGQWVSPAHGLWIPVPPEYHLWGAPPGIDVIDALMRHLETEYYVGWLSAAALYGATHQAVQVFQVATATSVRDRQVGRTRFRFYTRRRAFDIPTRRHASSAAMVRVSTLSTTMLDVANDILISGGLSNAATVIIELAEHADFRVDDLAAVAAQFPATAGRRVGWFLESLAGRTDLDPLREAMLQRGERASLLSPWGGTPGYTDSRWALTINDEVEEES